MTSSSFDGPKSSRYPLLADILRETESLEDQELRDLEMNLRFGNPDNPRFKIALKEMQNRGLKPIRPLLG